MKNKNLNPRNGGGEAGSPPTDPAKAAAEDKPRKAFSAHCAEIKAMLAEMAAETAEWTRAAGGSIADAAANWVHSEYLQALRHELADTPPGPKRFSLLRAAAAVVALLQRAAQTAARLLLDREKFAFLQQKHRDVVALAQKEEEKLRDPKLPLTDEDRRAIIAKADEILGLA